MLKPFLYPILTYEVHLPEKRGGDGRDKPPAMRVVYETYRKKVTHLLILRMFEASIVERSYNGKFITHKMDV